MFQKKSPDPLPTDASAERGVFSNYLEFLEMLVGLRSYFHYRGVPRGRPRKAACVTKPTAPAGPGCTSSRQRVSAVQQQGLFFVNHMNLLVHSSFIPGAGINTDYFAFCVCTARDTTAKPTTYFHIQPEQEKKLLATQDLEVK